MLFASAKSQSAREASHQPAFMSNCLTISHTVLPLLPSGRTVFWSDLESLGRWKGGRVVSWEGGKDGRAVSWEGGKDGRAVRWQGKRFLVLFKSGGRRLCPRFHLFVSDVNQPNEGAGWLQDYLVRPQGWKDFH